MRKVITFLLLGLSAMVPAGAEERTEAVEARTAAARIEGSRHNGLIVLTMGERTDGAPPAASPERRACLEVVDKQRGLVDRACAPADVFVDDLFLYAEGQATLPSEVVNAFGQHVADSELTFSGVWHSDMTTRTCEPGHRAFGSAPVFIALDAGAAVWCTATATVTLHSREFGTPQGNLVAVTGVVTTGLYRGPKVIE